MKKNLKNIIIISCMVIAIIALSVVYVNKLLNDKNSENKNTNQLVDADEPYFVELNNDGTISATFYNKYNIIAKNVRLGVLNCLIEGGSPIDETNLPKIGPPCIASIEPEKTANFNSPIDITKLEKDSKYICKVAVYNSGSRCSSPANRELKNSSAEGFVYEADNIIITT